MARANGQQRYTRGLHDYQEQFSQLSARVQENLAGDQVLPRITSNVGVWGNQPESNPLAQFLASLSRLGIAEEDLLPVAADEAIRECGIAPAAEDQIAVDGNRAAIVQLRTEPLSQRSGWPVASGCIVPMGQPPARWAGCSANARSRSPPRSSTRRSRSRGGHWPQSLQHKR